MGVHPVIALENKVSTKPGRKHFDAKWSNRLCKLVMHLERIN